MGLLAGRATAVAAGLFGVMVCGSGLPAFAQSPASLMARPSNLSERLAQSRLRQSIFAQRPITELFRDLKLPVQRGDLKEIVPGYVLVRFNPLRAAELAQATPSRRKMLTPAGLGTATFRNQIQRTGWTVWQIGKDQDPRAVARQLMQSRQVSYAQPMNKIYPLLPEPNDGDWSTIESGEPMIPLGDGVTFRRLWYVDDIDGWNAWNLFPNVWYSGATRPQNVPTIAVIDTGVSREHPDYMNAGATSTDVADGGQFELDLDAQFTFGEVIPDGTAEDVLGHGTHVTGLALAAGNNGSFDGRGMIGTGYGCKGMNLRVFDDSGNGSDADAAGAIFYAVENGADIINMSLGTENYSQLFQDAVTYAFQRGVLVVCASNEDGAGGGDLGPIYPAACSGSFAVTANGPDFVHASDYYAGTGSYLDLAAPGGNAVIDIYDPENPVAKLVYIWSTTMTVDNPILQNPGVVGYYLNYGYLLGTSMACPIVAGAAGTYYQMHDLRAGQGWSNVRAYRSLQRSALSVYGAPKGSWEPNQGYGCLDFNNFLQDLNSRSATAGAIEGIVYINGIATANVPVRCRRDGGTVTYTTTTLPDGTYRYDQLPEGNYNVWVTTGGTRTKRAVVVTGSDCPAVDFHNGVGYDDPTPPVIARFSFEGFGPGNTTSHFKLWAHDQETGIYASRIRIGTSPGASNVLADQLLTQNGLDVSLSHPAITPTGKLFATVTVLNGIDGSSTMSIPLRGTDWNSEFVTHSIPTTVTRGTSFNVSVTFRNNGTEPWFPDRRMPFHLAYTGTSAPNVWGMSRARLSMMAGCAPGGTVTIPLRLTAPSTPGTYSFRWQLERGTAGFGSHSAASTITVQ
jgi:hypothetical protein